MMQTCLAYLHAISLVAFWRPRRPRRRRVPLCPPGKHGLPSTMIALITSPGKEETSLKPTLLSTFRASGIKRGCGAIAGVAAAASVMSSEDSVSLHSLNAPTALSPPVGHMAYSCNPDGETPLQL